MTDLLSPPTPTFRVHKDWTYYLAGPMTGIAEWNYPAFNAATATLREQGLTVINPAENDGGSPDAGDWTYYMRQDLAHVAQADALVLLPGWRTSRGATLEVYIAKQLGLPLLRINEDGRLAPLFELIGLSGYARSGKDTAAALLADDGWQRVAFADVLKAAAVALDPFVSGELRLSEAVENYGWEGVKDHFPEGRRLLQRLGTEVGRELLGANIWVDLLLNSLEDGGRYVVTDCRFPNEAQAVAAAGGSMIRIERAGYGPANAHLSEVALDDYPFRARVGNDGTLEDFKVALRAAVQATQSLLGV